MSRKTVLLGILTSICMVLEFSLAPAQDSRPVPADDLQSGVDEYLSERDDRAAEAEILGILSRWKDRPLAVEAAIRARPELRRAAEGSELWVPYRGQFLPATVILPARPGGQAPPVILDISRGTTSTTLQIADAVTCFVKGYTPPEFSDEGRDAFLKILRSVAHATSGDADRLWLCGFSWAAHASYDTALHRPRSVQGIVPCGGGPRRVHFRLLAQLAGVRTLAFCGAKDDPELVWNLREVERLTPTLKIDYRLAMDAAVGHALPLEGMAGVGTAIFDTPPATTEIPATGSMLADGPGVESPWLRIDAVDDDAVAVPQRIPVSAALAPDAARRATIDAMRKRVARLEWKLERKGGTRVMTLSGSGVRRATVFFRAPWLDGATPLEIFVKGKKVFAGTPVADARVLLVDARRTGWRMRPAVATVEVVF